MKRLLITGAGGFLGWNLCRTATNADNWSIYGIFRSRRVDIPGVGMVHADLTRFDDLKRVFDEVRPEAVIHAAATPNPNYCQVNRSESRRINVDASVNIAGMCADAQIPCVFTSTDLVFDGLHAPYAEEDPVSPISVYGEQKAAAEEQMMQRHPGTAVCRMPLLFGDGGPAASSFIQPFIRAMREGRELVLFTDEFRTPTGGASASRGLLMALEKGSGMVLHLGGPERISRFEFGLLMAEVLGLPGGGIVAGRQEDFPMPAPRPGDVSLDSRKAFAMGFHPTPLREELAELKTTIL